MADSKVTLPILREHWRLLEPKVDTIQSGDSFLQWHTAPPEWISVPIEWVGANVTAYPSVIIRRRVPALPTCETCEYFNARESRTPFSCYLGNGLPAPRANDYCSKHSALNKAQEERG